MKAVLIVLAILLAGAIGWMLSRPGNPNAADIARLQKELNEAKTAIGRLSPAPGTPQGMPPILSAPPPGAVPPPSMTAPGGRPPVPGGGAAEMQFAMASPREMIAQQSQVQTQMLYGDLLSSLQLSPENRAKLEGVLAERAMSRSELDLKLLDPNLTPEQKKNMAAEFEAAKKASDAVIRSQLDSEEAYQKFLHVEDTKPERTQFQMLGGLSHFESAGEPLSQELQDQLIGVMAATRKTVAAQQPPADNATVDDRINTALRSHDQATTAAATEAAKFLTPVQMEAFNKMQQNARTNLEMGMRMTSAMQIKR